MSCRSETAGAFVWRFCPEDPPPLADRVRALLQARLVDEITEQAIELELSVTSLIAGLAPRSAAGGRVGLVGRPLRVFPQLDAAPAEVGMQVRAPGYLPVVLNTPIGPIAGYPDVFAVVDLGDVGLHRRAVSLGGRTLRRDSLLPTVVAGATVRIDGYWPVFPPLSVAPPAVMQAPDLAALAPPFYAARDPATATLRRRDIAPLAGEDKTILAAAGTGSRRLRLSARNAVFPGTVLILNPADPGRREWIPVAQVDTTSSPDQPAWITLAHPLVYPQHEAAVCQIGDLQIPLAPNALTRAAIPGDETVFLAALGGLASGVVVEMDDGLQPPEYHQLRLYEALSDADGGFRLPPLARVAMVLLHAERMGLISPDDMRVAPEYRAADEHLTVMFP